jgi:hypothetical protein
MADRHRIWVLVCLLIVAAVGSTYLTVEGHREPTGHALAFKHELHLGEGMACSDCHTGLQEEGEPGFPTLSVCADCHDAADAEEDAEPGSVPAHFFNDDETILQPSVMKLAEDILFSHQVHIATAKIECGTCHKGIETSSGIPSEMRLAKDDCLACHAARGGSAPDINDKKQCDRCHKTVTSETPPSSHRLGWEERHGKVIRGESEKIEDRCNLCHTESTCVGCHKDTEPESHNAFWRLKGHSLAAAADRQKCVTCHQPDLCNACHVQTAPRSHVGGWGSPGDRHCSSCHLDGSGRRGCALCHQGAPSHATAPLQPASHSPGMNCRQCHGVGQPLPHRDTGVSCNACHR